MATLEKPPAPVSVEKEKTDVRISVEVPISATAYNYLKASSNGKTPEEKFAQFAKWFIERQAGGALMIEPTDMDYLAGLNQGQRFETSKDVVALVEQALKRDDGQHTFKVQIDPVLIGPMEEYARFASTTVDEFVNAGINMCMTNGWLAELTPASGRLMPMEGEHVAAFQKLTGKYDFTVKDVIDAITAGKKLKAA